MNWYTILKQLKVRPPTALKAIYFNNANIVIYFQLSLKNKKIF